MNIRSSLLIVLPLLLLPAVGRSQHDQPPDAPDRPRSERLEKFRRMRLIEVLDLNESDAVRFFAKQTVHEDTMRSLMQQRNKILDDIQAVLKDTHDAKELEAKSDDVLAIDRRLVAERERYQRELRGFLTPQQFARYLVFERNFGREVREAIEEMHQDRRRGGD